MLLRIEGVVHIEKLSFHSFNIYYHQYKIHGVVWVNYDPNFERTANAYTSQFPFMMIYFSFSFMILIYKRKVHYNVKLSIDL